MAAPQRSARKAPPWLRNSIDAAPAILFLAVLLITHDFRKGTWALVAASAVALAANLVAERRIAPLPAVSGGLALVFGGLSLALHRNDILQMKMTIVDGLLGAALFIGLAMGRNPLKLMLGQAFQLSDKAWATLAIRYGAFWWFCAAANEVVRRTQTAEVWGVFRLVILGAAIVFSLAQTPFLLKNGAFSETPKPPEPPDPGF
ncbi:inner membrane-spanning protein YciB [Caulobacter sp. KR2-114]|uniref:inner membrane-spanning protein YciB n=1 Tax=Caulobacter sp. KR2-114 TaxID=3400912 RepID=UPI003C0640CB